MVLVPCLSAATGGLAWLVESLEGGDCGAARPGSCGAESLSGPAGASEPGKEAGLGAATVGISSVVVLGSFLTDSGGCRQRQRHRVREAGRQARKGKL